MNSFVALLLVTYSTQSCKAFSMPVQPFQRIPVTSLLHQSTNAYLPKDSKRRNNSNNVLHSKSQLFMIGDFFNINKKDSKDDNDKDNQVTRNNEEVSTNNNSAYVDDDPVEKLFNFFFGAKEEKPMGLARFGAERFPGT